MSAQHTPHEYVFDSLTLTYRTLGVPFLSEKTQERIESMSVDEATRINKAAWKQRREAASVCNRHNSFSVSGNGSVYDRMSQWEMVAGLVCKATYRRMHARATGAA